MNDQGRSAESISFWKTRLNVVPFRFVKNLGQVPRGTKSRSRIKVKVKGSGQECRLHTS
jgi:hypothetical protein